MDIADKIAKLSDELREESHSTKAIDILKSFAEQQKNTAGVDKILGQFENILQPPVEFEVMLANRLCLESDEFDFLQGDIIRTESAYYIGERVVNSPTFIIGTSACDLVKDRRECITLFRVEPILAPRNDDEEKIIKQLLSNNFKFKSTTSMILPKFPYQDEDVIYNIIELSRPHSITSQNLRLAHRVYSLTSLGWRIFGAVYRFITSRQDPRDEIFRNNLEIIEKIEDSA
ncbi:hypothetical protein GCM10010840_14150 [Deinococcus aerolatus]|uniref:Uncharacterized protein n=1 Tax=Deinococcus aerolatus TaxID=522487 RepID=A0ABQ2G6Q0_9DEIO|nr:hypothetical protein [Deinococcus aerolatus]GGL77370.1 hypothetical protein GCM10010840_14150 [Deinococcus aerolatus]